MSDPFAQFPEFLNARVKFWACPVEGHKTVEWHDNFARCMEPGCGLSNYERGMWGMHCLNAYDEEQQQQILVRGTIGWGTFPQGPCHRGAQVEMFTKFDATPGPRFSCLPCARQRLQELGDEHGWE